MFFPQTVAPSQAARASLGIALSVTTLPLGSLRILSPCARKSQASAKASGAGCSLSSRRFFPPQATRGGGSGAIPSYKLAG
jgi:hypothetical protein